MLLKTSEESGKVIIAVFYNNQSGHSMTRRQNAQGRGTERRVLRGKHRVRDVSETGHRDTDVGLKGP